MVKCRLRCTSEVDREGQTLDSHPFLFRRAVKNATQATTPPSAGRDLIFGEDGDDWLYAVDNTSDYVSGGDGTDTAYVDPGWLENFDDVESIEYYHYGS